MKLRIDFKGYRFYIALTHSGKVRGVNSKLPDGNHFLMWDFDDIAEEDVCISLFEVQLRYDLSKIYLLNTGLPRYWHAYCFTRVSWGDCLKILAETQCLDKVYFKIGCIRGYFTLRYTAKKAREFEPARILPSRYDEDVDPYELSSFVTYWTKRM